MFSEVSRLSLGGGELLLNEGRSFGLDSFPGREIGWGRRKGMLCSGIKRDVCRADPERAKYSYSLCTSLRKQDPGAAALLLGEVGHPSASGSGSGRLWPWLEWGGPYPRAAGRDWVRWLREWPQVWGERSVNRSGWSILFRATLRAVASAAGE